MPLPCSRCRVAFARSGLGATSWIATSSTPSATIERYRCLLFTHKVSLYSFWALAVRKPDLLGTVGIFVRRRVD